MHVTSASRFTLTVGCAAALALAALCRPADAAPNPLVGKWLMRAEGIEISLELKANGRFYRVMKTAEGVEKNPGDYNVVGSTIQFVADGDTEAMELGFSMPDENTLKLTVPTARGLSSSVWTPRPPAGRGFRLPFRRTFRL